MSETIRLTDYTRMKLALLADEHFSIQEKMAKAPRDVRFGMLRSLEDVANEINDLVDKCRIRPSTGRTRRSAPTSDIRPSTLDTRHSADDDPPEAA